MSNFLQQKELHVVPTSNTPRRHRAPTLALGPTVDCVRIILFVCGQKFWRSSHGGKDYSALSHPLSSPQGFPLRMLLPYLLDLDPSVTR